MDNSADERFDFYEACENGWKSVVHAYLEAGGEVNFHSSITGATPLQAACFHQHREIVGMLLCHGANPDAAGVIGPYSRNHVPLPPLLCAYNDANIVGLLLNYGADPNVRDSRDGFTALHLAASDNQFDTAMLLIKHGAREDVPSKHGHTPVDHAQGSGNVALLDAWRAYKAAEAARTAVEDGTKIKPLSL